MESRIKFLHTIIAGSFLFLSVVSCQQEKEHIAPAVWARDSASVMVSYGVNTLISDSGIIKYRIVTERWDVNTARNPSKWSFEKGLFLEQFDEKFHIQAYIQADTAYYYDVKKLWELRGRVTVRNLDGLVFRSEELFWDENIHELYSHRFSRIVTPERELQGTYFRSDEHMTHYTVSNSKGSMDRNPLAGESEQNPSAPGDTAKQQPQQQRTPVVAKPKAPPAPSTNTQNKSAQQNVFKPRLSKSR